MNRTKKGSIIVEAIVMLGVIATMTPILYKHVAERREDIENINEANTLLLLKNATAEYIEANKETLTTGTLAPADIGIDISGYQIGIRKDSEGNIDAMITGTGGNDLKAAKVASLLGLSAGIYSAQNLTKAWGINGVWAEDISNYGFSSLPTGIPVVTTAYDKEDTSSGFNEEELKEFIETTTFNKLSADEICLKENCISEWANSSYEAIPNIINCNAGDSKACKKAFQKGANTSCVAIAKTYKENDSIALTDFYTIATSESTFLYNQPCVFNAGEAASPEEVIKQCNAAEKGAACRYGYDKNYNTKCEDILQYSPISGWYNLTTSFGVLFQPCYFVGTKVANPEQTIIECNKAASNSETDTNIACRYGYAKGYNTSCIQLVNNYPEGAGKINNITTFTGGSLEKCLKPCAVIGTISGGECRDINGWGWVRSNDWLNYWDSQTFCSGLEMELKSSGEIQNVGLWNIGSSNFFGKRWVWTRDSYYCSNSYPRDCGYLVKLFSDETIWTPRNNYWSGSLGYYALCGPK